MNQGYDPKLREAMYEIRGVLQKYDICGMVSLGSVSHLEFLVHMTASWSMIDQNAEKWNLKIRKNEPENSDATVGTIYGFRDICANMYKALDDMATEIEKHATIEHKSLIGREPDSVPEEH